MSKFDAAVAELGPAGKDRTALKLQFYDALTSDPDYSDLDVRIAWRLLSHLNGLQAIAWPSIETLAKEVGCAPRSARRAIKHLTTTTSDGRPPAFFIELGGGWKRSGVGRSNRYAPNPWRYEATGTQTTSKGNKTGPTPSAVEQALPNSDNLRPTGYRRSRRLSPHEKMYNGFKAAARRIEATRTQTTGYPDSNDTPTRTRESPYPLESIPEKNPERNNARVDLLGDAIPSTTASDATAHCSAKGDAESESPPDRRQRALIPIRMTVNGGRSKAARALEQDQDRAEREGIELVELQARETLVGEITAGLPSPISVRVNKRCLAAAGDLDGRARHEAVLAELDALKAIREKDGVEGLRAALAA